MTKQYRWCGVAVALSLAAALVAPAGAASPAVAATVVSPAPPASFTFDGSGWGHGIGMSQYGAYGMALAGNSATQILEHYYAPATVVKDSSNPPLRVQVLTGVSQVTISGPAGKWAIETAPGTWKQIAPGSIVVSWEKTSDGQARIHTVISGSDYRTSTSMPELNLRWSQDGVTVPGANAGSGSVSYHRGQIALGPLNGGVNVVSRLALNEYLYGLAEMPSSWPSAALQAQAIAGRTYALRAYAAGVQSKWNANLTDETTSQKYTGWNKESEGTDAYYGKRWAAAVDAVASGDGGFSVQYKGALAQTYYSSSSGGKTTSVFQAWGSTDIPYLQSQDDHWALSPAVNNPYASWTATLSQATVARAFGLTDVVKLQVMAKASSGAVKWMRATSSSGASAYLNDGTATDDVRVALGLKSAYFTVRDTPPVVVLPFDVQRLSGADRYGTAVAIAGAAYPASGELVLVSASQQSIVDGLVAAPFARSRNAPVLLADVGGIGQVTLADIQRRMASGTPIAKVWLVGGEGVLGPNVVTQLHDLGIADIERLSGSDRYGTAAAVDEEMGTTADVLVASGDNASLIDAAAAGGPAAALNRPIVLVAPKSVPQASADALTAVGATRAIVVGGTGAVSEAAVGQLTELGVTTERVAGADRYGTAVAVATRFVADIGSDTVLLAGGADTNLIDSVTGGVLGHLTLLTSATATTAVTRTWLQGHAVTTLQVAGGTGVVPDAVINGIG